MAPRSSSFAPRHRSQNAAANRPLLLLSTILCLLLVAADPVAAQPVEPPPATEDQPSDADGAATDAAVTDADDGAVPADDPLADEAPGEEAPATDITVPPKDTYGDQGEYERPEILWSSVALAEEKVADYGTAKRQAIAEVHRLRKRLKELGAGKSDLDGLTREAIEEIDRVSERLQNRAIVGYQRLGSGADADTEASMTDFQEVIVAQRRSKMVDSVLEVDEADLQRLDGLRAGLDGDARDLVDRMRVVRQSLADAELAASDVADELEQAELEFHAFRAGSEIFIHGVVFPIAGDYSPVTDSFGFPRMTGTPDEHWHEGIDLFAERGTPLVATERGVITKLGSGRLGGLKFWLKGESGTEWYYAHLDSFAPGLTNGQVVEAGELVGYVGNTGNAVGTPPHLHMQVHPDGGRAVNPFPLLKVVSDLEQASGEGPIYDYEIYTADRDEVAADAPEDTEPENEVEETESTDGDVENETPDTQTPDSQAPDTQIPDTESPDNQPEPVAEAPNDAAAASSPEGDPLASAAGDGATPTEDTDPGSNAEAPAPETPVTGAGPDSAGSDSAGPDSAGQGGAPPDDGGGQETAD